VLLDSKAGPSILGITLGFLTAMTVIYSLEHIIEYIENMPEDKLQSSLFSWIGSRPNNLNSSNHSTHNAISFPAGIDEEANEMELASLSQWDDGPVERASRAISIPEHRRHIQEHLQELMSAIALMESKSDELQEEGLSVKKKETIAEFIDEQVHAVQYKLDHCRRLLQGSEVELLQNSEQNSNHINNALSWVTDEKKERIRKGISGLKLMTEHLLEHISEAEINKTILKEMHLHMEYMDKQIAMFHESIEHVGRHWHHLHELVSTQLGDKLPYSLIIPVTLDCFVDGFLIGISSSISLKAGIVLGFANCLEMAFLGMAYTARLIKCTGSSYTVRMLALYCPPFVMFLSSGIGAVFGGAVQHIDAAFIGLVAFGAVALLFLVCNELLIEAKNAQGEEERWWISAMVFLGIYVVLLMDHAL
jgi:zinc transporter ZupT